MWQECRTERWPYWVQAQAKRLRCFAKVRTQREQQPQNAAHNSLSNREFVKLHCLLPPVKLMNPMCGQDPTELDMCVLSRERERQRENLFAVDK